MASRALPLRWRTLQDIADVLLATTDGSAKDRQTYDHNLAEYDRLRASVMTSVQRAMKKDAEAGRWVAFGRRHPDAPEETIPPYYWPFLDIDMEEDSAKGHDLLFRGIRCLLAGEIPADHPILEQIHPQAPDTPPASADEGHPVEDVSAPQPPITLYSGTQGRPSSVETLVIPELRRRAAEGVMEPSLARECRYLSEWLRSNHPAAYQIKPVSLENSLRQLHRELKSPPHETPTTPAGPSNAPLKPPLNYNFAGILMPLIHGVDCRYLDCRRGVAPLGMKGIDNDGHSPRPGGNQHLPRLH